MKHLLIAAILTLMTTSVGFSQNLPDPKFVRQANEVFISGNYYEAISVCQDAYKKLGARGSLRQKGDMAFKIAESYRALEIFDKANDWYGTCIELKYFDVVPEIYYYKGDMQRMMKDFDNAIKSYREFKRLAPKSRTKEVDDAIMACEKFKDFDEFETSRLVVKQEVKINTKQMDMAPSYMDKKGKVVVFSSSRDESTGTKRDPISGEKYMDLYIAEYDVNGNPTNVKSLDTKGVVNTTANEGSAVFDSKRKNIFFTRCPNAEKMNLGCEIWTAIMSGEDFEEPREIRLTVSDTISVGHPCLSADDQMLIFASDMKVSPNGEKSFGGRDLWYVNFDKRTKTWDSIPHNMGAMFNTAGNELFPSLGPNGQLYFASDGLPGIGGLDIFVAEAVSGQTNKWTGVKNMGYPFNSQANDYAMADFDGKSGFFTSERKTTSNQEYAPEIWSFNTPPNLFDLRVTVYESGKKSKKLGGAKVYVTISDGTKLEGTTKPNGKISWDVMPDKKGRYILAGKDFTLKAEKEGYYEDTKGAKFSTVGLEQSQSFLIEMPLLPIGEIRTPEVRYVFDQWVFIQDASCMSLDSLKFLDSMLKEYPNVTIDLFSHTDARGSDVRNQVLSENRAKAVYKHLVETCGIDPRRIRPVGRGEAEPATWVDENGKTVLLTEEYINQFKTTDKAKFEKLHTINRRTTAKITSTTFNSNTAPAADPEYSKFKQLPRL
jgi:peptidoglycan-associated lipoprotein